MFSLQFDVTRPIKTSPLPSYTLLSCYSVCSGWFHFVNTAELTANPPYLQQTNIQQTKFSRNWTTLLQQANGIKLKSLMLTYKEIHQVALLSCTLKGLPNVFTWELKKSHQRSDKSHLELLCTTFPWRWKQLRARGNSGQEVMGMN